MIQHETFFHHLANRKWHENDLTDVTWALCLSSEFFRDKFLSFFFDKIDSGKVLSIQREVPDIKDKDSRVDLFIQMKGDEMPYLIEVKIGDENHHFDQYCKAYDIPANRLGYIANYTVNQEGFEVKTWTKLYNKLIDLLPEINDREESLLIQGYLEYVKSVCGIYDLKPMNIKDFQSVFSLNVILERIVQNETPNYRTQYYSDKYSKESHWTYFEAEYPSCSAIQGKVWPFIGIVYNNPKETLISAGYERRNGWGKAVFDLIQSHSGRIGEIPTKYCKINETPSDAYYFYLSDDALNAFCETDDIGKQEDILRKFLDEVLLFPLRLLGADIV